MHRWVWQHSIKDASFTSWAEGAPAIGENFQDCALMALEVSLSVFLMFILSKNLIALSFLQIKNIIQEDFLWLDKDCLDTQAGIICQQGA